MPDYLTTADVVERTGVSSGTLRQWVRDGLLSVEQETEGRKAYLWTEDHVEAARAIAAEGSRGEASRQAMLHISEGVLSKLPGAADHYRLPGEVIAVSQQRVLRVQADSTIAELVRRAGPGNMVLMV